ncbi:hypothetical protein CBM2606_A30450 [Cupriavidus taiwanensis]|nr:hypothetical protein CBM2606_A30450 [Cupriavidus taiwanensis]
MIPIRRDIWVANWIHPERGRESFVAYVVKLADTCNPGGSGLVGEGVGDTKNATESGHDHPRIRKTVDSS